MPSSSRRTVAWTATSSQCWSLNPRVDTEPKFDKIPQLSKHEMSQQIKCDIPVVQYTGLKPIGATLKLGPCTLSCPDTPEHNGYNTCLCREAWHQRPSQQCAIYLWLTGHQVTQTVSTQRLHMVQKSQWLKPKHHGYHLRSTAVQSRCRSDLPYTSPSLWGSCCARWDALPHGFCWMCRTSDSRKRHKGHYINYIWVCW